MGIAPGYRARGRGKDRTTERELVLRVYVRKKIEEGRGLAHWRRIPHSFAGYVSQAGRRRLVRIPTDVCEVGQGRPQGAAPDVDYLRLRREGRRAEVGSVCALVRRSSDRRLVDPFQPIRQLTLL